MSGLQDIIWRWKGKRVLMLGDAINDVYVYGRITRKAPESNADVFMPGSTKRYPGGAANVRANVVSLGGIGTLHAPLDRSTKTRYVTQGGHQLRVDEDRAPGDVTPDIVEQLLSRFQGSLRHHDIVVLSDYNKGALRDEVLLPAIRMARDLGKVVIVDPKRKDWAAYAGADFITPSDQDFPDPQTVAYSPPPTIIHTKGQFGAMIIGEQRAMMVPGLPIADPVEVAGAGDTFVAALALALAADAEVFDAVRLAVAAGGIAVTHPGTTAVTMADLMAKARAI